MPGRPSPLQIHLTDEEVRTLRAWLRHTTLPHGLHQRARIILLLGTGMTMTHTASTVGLSRLRVQKWAQRWLQEGYAGLADRPRGGRGKEETPC